MNSFPRSYSTVSTWCSQECKTGTPLSQKIELDSENGFLSIENRRTISSKYSSKSYKSLKLINDKTISDCNPSGSFSFDYKKICDEKSILQLSRNIIRLLLGERILKKFDENNEYFNSFMNIFYSQKLENIFELSNTESKLNISCLHDSDLMCRFIFDEVLSDFLLLTQYISQIRVDDKINTNFDTANFRNISTRDYFMRLVRFSLCSPSLFIIMFIYIIRILECNPSLAFDTKNAHRLMLSSLIICIKLYDDKLLTYSNFAQIGGVSNKELTRIETEALKHINFKLKVDLEEFIQFTISIRIIGHYLRGLKSRNN
ncbi:PREG-like protein [Cryptosporidium ryanae]|uniref:PREG-like protein n=1 Tax=Cryptosporidium ryanae TaxID=515981 RepID=UPI00351A9BA5|nr:PREG-like protein [Cryptosporidium ryanae]